MNSNTMQEIGDRIRTQDNRSTLHPMFCVQILVRDTGYDSAYGDDLCWYNAELCECVYKEPEDLTGWEEFAYKDRWETVMFAFTEEGCREYLRLNGHNDKRRAFKGQVRIYVESFHRCPEMISIRKFLGGLEAADNSTKGEDHAVDTERTDKLNKQHTKGDQR